MAPHSSTFAWKIPWTEEPCGLQSMGSLESDTTEQLHFHFSLSCIGEENGNPLQCSCLENPRDGEGWWAAIYGVAQSRTRLKQLSSSSNEQGIQIREGNYQKYREKNADAQGLWLESSRFRRSVGWINELILYLSSSFFEAFNMKHGAEFQN